MVPQISQRFSGFRQSLLAVHAASQPQPNEASGSEREAVLSLLLNGVFPNTNRFGTGSIIDLSGAQSGQLDIVIERPTAPSFPIPGTQSRLYPFESVSGVVEVKSSLDKQWSQVIGTCEKFALLRPMPYIEAHIKYFGHEQVGFAPDPGIAPFTFAVSRSDLMKVPLYVFAYTGWTGPKTLIDKMRELPPPQGPSSVYVLDENYYVGWGRMSEIGNHKAVLQVAENERAIGEFLADVQKSLAQIYAMPPFLHHYVRQNQTPSNPTDLDAPIAAEIDGVD